MTMAPRPSGRGFTLIELMVTVVILAVLATVAVTSFRRYSMRASSQEAIGFLLELKLKQETYFTTYGQYAATGPSVTWYPAGDLGTQEMVAWELDCIGGDAIDRNWCAMGIRPGFSQCPPHITNTNDVCSYHQYYTDGWFPGAPEPPAKYINDPSRPWWYAVAQGDVDRNGDFSEWVISSEINEPQNRQGSNY